MQNQHAGSESRQKAVDHESRSGLVMLGSLAEKHKAKTKPMAPT